MLILTASLTASLTAIPLGNYGPIENKTQQNSHTFLQHIARV